MDHRDLAQNHQIYDEDLEFANAAARTGYSASADEIGRVAWQTDDDTIWFLADDSPLTWIELSAVPRNSVNVPTHVDTTWYTILTIASTTDTALALVVIVSGHSDDAATAAWAYHMLAYTENDGGSLTAGNNTPTVITEYDGAYDVQIVASGTNALIQVRRNGGSDYDIDWAVMAQIASF